MSSIGGGHAFGKAHGACPAAEASAEGFCPNGDTWQDKFTSGLEVVWTQLPTTWTNLFFTNVVDLNYTESSSPAGALQWEAEGEGIQMLTTDLALLFGDPEYEQLSRSYAADLDLLSADFGEAWYQLMSRDMGPRTRCLGDELPEELQAYEVPHNLGSLDSSLPDYIPVRSMIQESIDGDSEMIAMFSTLAVQCSSSFRMTDYIGGCNGAAIRFSPQQDWPENAGASDSLAALQPIKDAFPDVSWADIIVLAGLTAVEASGGKSMPFCGGRSDAENGDSAIGLEYTIYNGNTYDSLVYSYTNKGMTLSEGVALEATGMTELSDPILKRLLSSVTRLKAICDDGTSTEDRTSHPTHITLI